jgi:low affinity Fe/Cu permease
MALLDTVTALTQEISYAEELIQNLLKISEKRQAAMRQRFDQAIVEENETTHEVINELNALKRKLAALIETPSKTEGDAP